MTFTITVDGIKSTLGVDAYTRYLFEELEDIRCAGGDHDICGGWRYDANVDPPCEKCWLEAGVFIFGHCRFHSLEEEQ